MPKHILFPSQYFVLVFHYLKSCIFQAYFQGTNSIYRSMEYLFKLLASFYLTGPSIDHNFGTGEAFNVCLNTAIYYSCRPL